MNYTEKDIYESANNFYLASLAVNEKLSKTDDIQVYIAPITTLTSFSIELYLKCIYMIENNKPAENIHGLDKLFDALGDESKLLIKFFYDNFIQQDLLVNELKKQVPELNTNLEDVLKESSKAFIKWRYSYEKNLCDFPSGTTIINALKARIKTLKPDWN